MAKYKDMSKGSQIAIVVLVAILAIIVTLCVIAAIKSGTDNIGFFEAFSQMFGGASETAKDVVEENPDILEDAVESALKLI